MWKEEVQVCLVMFPGVQYAALKKGSEWGGARMPPL